MIKSTWKMLFRKVCFCIRFLICLVKLTYTRVHWWRCHAGVPRHIPRILRINAIRVWVEEERGTGGNRGKKRKEERGRKVPASMPAASERGHIVKRVGPVSATTKCVSAAAWQRVQREHLRAGPWSGLSVRPTQGVPLHAVGDADRPLAECPGVPLKGMVRGHGRFLGPIKCLGFCFPWAESWKWRLLTSSNNDSSFQLTCQKERPDAGLWGICHNLVVFVKISWWAGIFFPIVTVKSSYPHSSLSPCRSQQTPAMMFPGWIKWDSSPK